MRKNDYIFIVLFLTLVGVYFANPLMAQIPLQPALGEKDFLWIRVEFKGDKKLRADNEQRIDSTMSALDHYMQIHSNGKASVGAYEVTPVFQSSLSNEEDLKNNLSTIRTAMINIQNMNEGETVLLVAKYVLKDGKDDVYLWFR